MTIQIIEIAFHGVGQIRSERLEESRNVAGTLIVSAEADARAVAEVAEHERAGLILVTDHAGAVCGLIAPAWTVQQVRRYGKDQARTLVEAVEVLAEGPESPYRGYSHEWLNYERPQLYWCEAGHYTDRCPCAAGHKDPCGPSD